MDKDIPYVLVQHKDTGKAFTMSRGYNLMTHIVSLRVAGWMVHTSVQSSAGWFPTMEHQSPSWAKEFREEDFVAYWIDYDKQYQDLVVAGA
jgi:hypothetical protein